MAKNAALNQTARIIPSGCKRPIGSRAAELASCARAVLSVPAGIWTRFSNAPTTRSNLESALKQLHSAEELLVSGMHMRINSIVRKQALDLQCWDFLAAGRTRLRTCLSPNSAEWPQFGFDGPQMRIPATYAGRQHALHQLTRWLARHRQHESAEFRFTVEHGRRISKAIKNVTTQTSEARQQLIRAARNLHESTGHISAGLDQARSDAWLSLIRADHRWIAPAFIEHPDPAPAGSNDGKCATRLQPDSQRLLRTSTSGETTSRFANPDPDNHAAAVSSPVPQDSHPLENLTILAALRLLFPGA